MSVSNSSLLRRFWLSWLFAYRILFDRRFADRAAGLLEPAASAPSSLIPSVSAIPTSNPNAATAGALQLLSLLQREGRLLDFLQQDVTAFGDADVGAAARVVHDGCQRALGAHARVVSVRDEAEGALLTLDQAHADVKLVGKVAGSAPFRGVLRHRGWRVLGLHLPTVIGTPDLGLVAQAELELS